MLKTNFCEMAALYLDLVAEQGVAQTTEDALESCVSWAEGCEEDYSDYPHYKIACFIHGYFYNLYKAERRAERLTQQREDLERSFSL